METMTETGTEKRVDELSKRVDHGFEQVDKRIEQVEKRMDHGFDQVDRRFEQVEKRMDRGFEQVDRNFERADADLRELRVAITSLHRAMFVFTGTTVGSILAGIVVIVLTHS
jgi:hypothetical protein